MTTAGVPEDLLREAIDILAHQGKRIEALEAMLFQLAPLTIPAASIQAVPPPHDTVAVANDDTKHNPRRPTPTTIPVPIPRERRVENGVSPAQVVASLDDVVWSISPDGEVVFLVAGAVEKTFGRDAHSLRSVPGAWLDTLPPDERSAYRVALAAVPVTDLLNLEHRVASARGPVRWLHSRGRLVRDADGRPLRIDGVSTDITARVRTQRGLFAILEGVGPATGAAFLEKLVQHVAKSLEVRAVLVAVPAADPHAARTLAVFLDGRLATNFEFATTGLMEDVFAGGSRFTPADARDHFPADPLLAQLRAESVIAEPLIDAAGAFLGTLAVIDDRPLRPTSPDVRGVLKALAPRVAVAITPSVAHADLNTAVRATLPVLTRLVGGRVTLDLPPVVPFVRADAGAVSLLLLNLVASLPASGGVTIRTAAVAEGAALTVTHSEKLPDTARLPELAGEAGGVAAVASSEWGTTVRVVWKGAPLRLVPADPDVGNSAARPAKPN
jgi:PAS domain-containing protein/GAF domain-containing protein